MTPNITTLVVPAQKKPEPALTLGDFIAGVYDACDEQPRARAIVWLAAREQVVVFRRRKGPLVLK